MIVTATVIVTVTATAIATVTVTATAAAAVAIAGSACAPTAAKDRAKPATAGSGRRATSRPTRGPANRLKRRSRRSRRDTVKEHRARGTRMASRRKAAGAVAAAGVVADIATIGSASDVLKAATAASRPVPRRLRATSAAAVR